MWRTVLFILSSLMIVSCSSETLSIDDLNVPLIELQKIVSDNLPLRTKHVSQNGREFFSDYFVPSPTGYDEAQNAKKRCIAHVIVLNDRRPYNISITVRVEERDADGGYAMIRNDEGLARVLSRRIQKALHDRREDRNFIDDFRIF